MTDRQTFISLIKSALLANRADYARHLATDWLSVYPGDIEFLTLLSRAELELGHVDRAVARLRRITEADPECAAAYDLLASALRTKGNLASAHLYQACAGALQGVDLDPEKYPAWTIMLQKALRAYAQGNLIKARLSIHDALAAGPEPCLPTWIAVKIQEALEDHQGAAALAKSGLKSFPECLYFQLIVGASSVEDGDVVNGMEYIHRAMRMDPDGSRAARVLGEDHPYKRLWPDTLQAAMSRPVPASVAAMLGDNMLATNQADQSSKSLELEEVNDPAGSAKENGDHSESDKPPESPRPVDSTDRTDSEFPEPQPWEAFRGPDPGAQEASLNPAEDDENLLEIERDFERLAARVNARRRVRHEDGRSPAYIVLSSRTRLQQVFGSQGYEKINDSVLNIVEAVRRKPGWSAYRFFTDDPPSLDTFNIAPADPGNAWEVKLRVADLDQALAKRGEMIAAVLIVGGENVVPFHLLPNPTDDDDDDVPSDNPYAARDENYFIPEWPVGRLPIEDSLQALQSQLQSIAQYHQWTNRPSNPFLRVRYWFQRRFGGFFRPPDKTTGYTASIWRKASFAVFKSIGDPRSMVASPPAEADRLPGILMRPSNLSYFNLHGIEDAPEWYGQKDPLQDEPGALDFPVALRPQDVINSGHAPRVVFTEACYGAHSIGKTPDTALSLKFLASGTRAVVGSTKISYGSITPPLIAADLLGRLFWQYLNQSLPVGEALRRAKLKLAGEMHQRQGFLDGEDQKTIISFVLFGDPLFRPENTYSLPGEKTVIRSTQRPSAINTACAKGGREINQETLDEATSEKIESIVSKYLPGMKSAVCTIHNQHISCQEGDHVCPSQTFQSKSPGKIAGGMMVVTLSKAVKSGERNHPHYARLTLDKHGKVLKLAVSR
ncbi:MAG: C25 family cysteine peptidase [Anaerolineales bacterium]|nr:C25 family cysteine peptidase [Anaerolineales bacterium]